MKMKNNIKRMITAAALCAALIVAGGCATAPASAPASEPVSVEPEAPIATVAPAPVATIAPVATDAPVEPGATVEPAAGTGFVAAAGVYDEVISQYANAERNNFYPDLVAAGDFAKVDAAFGDYPAVEWRASQQPAYYGMCDINGDGVEELIISSAADADVPANYDIFTNDGIKPIRLFDADFGYRQNFTVLKDGTIEISWSASAFESGTDFYTLEGQEAKLVTSLAIVFKDTGDADYTQDGAAITSEDYENVIAQYEADGLIDIAFKSVLEAQ